jgi:hypothetical protein
MSTTHIEPANLADVHQFDGDEYQNLARSVAAATESLLKMILEDLTSRHGPVDAGAVVVGCIGGLLEVWTTTIASDDEIISTLTRAASTALPQIRLSRACGHAEAGHA